MSTNDEGPCPNPEPCAEHPRIPVNALAAVEEVEGCYGCPLVDLDFNRCCHPATPHVVIKAARTPPTDCPLRTAPLLVRLKS